MFQAAKRFTTFVPITTASKTCPNNVIPNTTMSQKFDGRLNLVVILVFKKLHNGVEKVAPKLFSSSYTLRDHVDKLVNQIC